MRDSLEKRLIEKNARKHPLETRCKKLSSGTPAEKGKGAARPPWKGGRGPAAPSLRALPPMGADAPCASAASRPPADWLRSTLGDGGLSCRVRDGIGRSPPPWPRSRRAPPARPGLPGRPGGRIASFGRRSSSRDRPPRGTGVGKQELGLLVPLA